MTSPPESEPSAGEDPEPFALADPRWLAGKAALSCAVALGLHDFTAGDVKLASV